MAAYDEKGAADVAALRNAGMDDSQLETYRRVRDAYEEGHVEELPEDTLSAFVSVMESYRDSLHKKREKLADMHGEKVEKKQESQEKFRKKASENLQFMLRTYEQNVDETDPAYRRLQGMDISDAEHPGEELQQMQSVLRDMDEERMDEDAREEYGTYKERFEQAVTFFKASRQNIGPSDEEVEEQLATLEDVEEQLDHYIVAARDALGDDA